MGKKWSKGKVRDKLNNMVLFDKPTYDKLYKEVPTYKLITPSVVSERLKVRVSLASCSRRIIKERTDYQSSWTQCSTDLHQSNKCGGINFYKWLLGWKLYMNKKEL